MGFNRELCGCGRCCDALYSSMECVDWGGAAPSEDGLPALLWRRSCSAHQHLAGQKVVSLGFHGDGMWVSPSFPRALKPQCCGDGGCWDTWLCTCSVCRDTMSRSLTVCASPAMMRPSCTSAEQMCKHVTAEMGGGDGGVATPAKGLFLQKSLILFLWSLITSPL